MPRRACIICGAPSPQGRSRCSLHGRSTPTGPRLHDSTHDRIAKQVKREEKVCALCGLGPLPGDPLEAGHIVALSLGGKSMRSNYRAEHRSHNRAQGHRIAKAKRSRFFPTT
jgi:5-methylcytosine-specific restriction endonuclease McrA